LDKCCQGLPATLPVFLLLQSEKDGNSFNKLSFVEKNFTVYPFILWPQKEIARPRHIHHTCLLPSTLPNIPLHLPGHFFFTRMLAAICDKCLELADIYQWGIH